MMKQKNGDDQTVKMAVSERSAEDLLGREVQAETIKEDAYPRLIRRWNFNNKIHTCPRKTIPSESATFSPVRLMTPKEAIR